MDTFYDSFLTMISSIDDIERNDIEKRLIEDKKYRSIYQKLTTLMLLTEHAEAISSGELVPINADATSVSMQLWNYAEVLKFELIKEVMLTCIIPKLKDVFVVHRKDILTDYANRFPLLNSNDINGNSLISAIIDRLDDLDFISDNITGMLLPFGGIIGIINEYYDSNIVKPDLSESDAESYVRIVGKLKEVFEKYTDKHNKVLKEKVCEDIKGIVDEEDENKSKIRKLKSIMEYSYIPQFKELFTYYSTVYKLEKIQREMQNQANRVPSTRLQSYNDNFVIHDITGEVITLKDKTEEERIKLFASAQGNFSWRHVKKYSDAFNAEVSQREIAIVSNRISKKGLKERKDFNKDRHAQELAHIEAESEAREELTQRYDETFGTKQSIAERKKIREAMAGGESVPYSHDRVSYEELAFVAQNFEYKKDEQGKFEMDGPFPVVIDKTTKKDVLSPRTIATFNFATLWSKHYGGIKEENRTEYESALNAAEGILYASDDLDLSFLYLRTKRSLKSKKCDFFEKAQESFDKPDQVMIKSFYKIQDSKVKAAKKARSMQ